MRDEKSGPAAERRPAESRATLGLGHVEHLAGGGCFQSPFAPMGDWLKFHSVVTNVAGRSAHGVVAWISLVQADPGKEQPVDLWRIGARTKP